MNHLVILAPNWLGDAVLALPAIADVRRAAAAARIVAAARPSVAPLFALVPEIDETIVLDRPAALTAPGSWRALGAELLNRRFGTALVLPNSVHAALVASRAGIPERWGYRSALRNRLLTRSVAPPRRLHQVDFYQHLVGALGFPNLSAAPRIRVPEAARAAGARLLCEAGWDGRAPLVALAPGAAYGGAKRWPAESFAELAARLAANDVQSVMVGAGADADTAADVRRALAARMNVDAGSARRSHLLDVVGRTDLSTLAGVLTHCRTLVTNDSGAMHLAAAAGVAVTAVFGPTDDRVTRPVGAGHVVIAHPVWCRPCMLRECPIDHRCMRGIRAATVAESTRRAL